MSHTEDSFLSTHLGKVLPNRELSISKDGEILVRGKTLFSGYDNGYSLERPLTPSGWFASGDLGSFTPDGNLIYKGRKDNMFISGGENIYPEEIEKALSSFPGLLHSTVIPSPDLEFGHRPVAFIHLEHELIHKDSLKEHLLSKVPKFCVPIDFHPIPISFLGNTKILRKELAKYYINNFLK
jgi:O-succinylbenzoic acid--CoA ligase